MEVTVEKKYNPWKDSMIMGIVLLVVGLLLAVGGEDSLEIILMIIGILIAVSGLLSIYEGVRNKAGVLNIIGAVKLVIGLVLAIMPSLFSDLLMILLALGLIIMGIVAVLNINSGFAVSTSNRIISLLIGLLLIAMGLLAFMDLDGTADIVMIVIGVVVAFAGAMMIYNAYRVKNAY